jgi:hypothetical protein
MRLKDDRGSLPMALLVITIGLSLSAMLMPVVVRQISTTRTTVDRNSQLNAAQVGLDVMMARVRAAAEDTQKGVSGLLENLPPCALKGNAGATSAGESLPWDVTIEYYRYDDLDDQGNPKPMKCPLEHVPDYATVTSKGSSEKGTRTLVAKYVFSTNNTNIPGGAIRIDTSTVGMLCLDAGLAKVPPSGTKVKMQICNGSSGQQFGYTAELFLKLINSEEGGSNGMCLNPGTSRNAGASIYVTLQPCPLPENIDPQQCTAKNNCQYEAQWSLDGNSRFASTDVKKQITENYCMTVQSPNTVGSSVILNKGCGGDGTNVTWRSDPSVGAGMAGDATNQLVNYSQFSRCLDVTNKEPARTYMIAWFCKQAPDKNIDWNQMWYHTAPVAPASSKTDIITILLNKNTSSRYCLKSPLSTASNVYVTVVSCPPGSDTSAKELQWTIYHNTGAYATSYRIQDNKGYCLTPTDLNATPKDTHSDGTSKVKVAVCSSSELQKWNAPANLKQPTPLTDLREK